jgi:Fe-S-cluster containining protein
MEKERQRQEHLAELQSRLEEAMKISSEELAAQIREIGFKCLRCGECCTGDDNSVVVFPFEIRRITDIAGDSWLNVAEPPSVGEWDLMGNFHTLEWRVKKCKKSCKYHVHAPSECRIYEAKPLLCSTYPFYLDGGDLRCSECRGLGEPIDPLEAKKIAARLKERNIVEIQEAISLLENYGDFQRGYPGEGSCIVHDSEGEHRIDWDEVPALRHNLKIQ